MGKYGKGKAEFKIGFGLVCKGAGGQELQAGAKGGVCKPVCLEGAKLPACTFPNIACTMQHLRPPSLHDIVVGDDAEVQR